MTRSPHDHDDERRLSRRRFLEPAATFGAVAVLGRTAGLPAAAWRERRDLYPEGVASGDADAASVILWTRRPWSDGRTAARLIVEVSEDDGFRRLGASAPVAVSAESDWTCRALVGGLHPARVYWYRFTDEDGNGSRIGRTITAPRGDDTRPVRFAFVSCQNVNQGSQHAYWTLTIAIPAACGTGCRDPVGVRWPVL